MAKQKPLNATCEECQKPFHSTNTKWTTCCSTKCRMDNFKKIKAERDEKATAK